MVDYKEAILFVINYVEDNAHILACAYDTLGREEMRRFLYQDFISIVETIIDNVEKELGICMEKEFKLFLCNLYTESLAGILIEWFKNPQDQNKEQIVEYLSIIFVHHCQKSSKIHLPIFFTSRSVFYAKIC